MTAAHRFDASYYHRHYQSRARVHAAAEVGMLASGVVGMAGWLGVELRTALDIGAGPGLWRDWFRRHRPAVHYRSTDFSPFACKAYGHERRDIAAWRSRERYDLVVCQGVLQYLEADAAAAAIENLGAMSRGLLYLEAITRRDLDEVVDRERTDLAIHARSGAWYRRRLAPHFVQLGAGLWAARRAGLALYELEGSSP
jgi:hypothetical protein